MARRCVLYLIRTFYDLLNLRGCRRNLASLYSNTAWAMRGPAAALYYMLEVPRNRMLRSVLLHGLGNFLREKVRRLRAMVNVYSGSVIRGDGQWKIARRVVERRSGGRRGPHTRPWNVLLAWVGIDGALLDVPRLSKSECIEDCLKDLDRVVTDLRRDRLEAGLSISEACPVAHATDSYGKHRLQYRAFYKRKFPEISWSVDSNSARGDATGAHRVHFDNRWTVPTGDPGHDTFGLKRATAIGANDTEDLQHDHAELMSRLSVAPLPSPAIPHPQPEPLESQAARDLLLCAVQRSGKCFKEACIADPVGTAELKNFLGQSRVRECVTWRAVFGVRQVPRGVLARIARRCSVNLHKTSQYHGYESLKHFKAEIRCMVKWYMPGRKLDKRRVGPLRSERQSPRVTGHPTAWSAKVKAHYKRLQKPLRLEGLWRWHKIAMGIIEAGVPMQSGTIPAERFWAGLLEMLPASSHNVSLEWFEILLALCYLRDTYRHFGCRRLPSWCERDALLAGRLDEIVSTVRQVAEKADDSTSEVARLIFDAFR